MAEIVTDKWLSLARDAFSESNGFFDSGIRSEIEADMRRFQGLHPVGSKYLSSAYAHRSRFFRPRTRSAIRKHEAIAAAALFGNEDVIALQPEDDTDELQIASASVWQEVMNYRLKKTIPWFQTAIGAYQDAMVTGVCVSYQHWLYDSKSGIDKPCIKLLPVENFRFAPTAQWYNPVETSPYVIEMIPMLVRDVLDRMELVDEKTGQPKWKKLTTEEITRAAKGYSDSLTLIRNQNRSDASSQASAITEFSPVWVHRNFIEINGEHKVFYTLGDIARLSDPKPIDEVYFHGERPYVVGNCVIESHKLYPPGNSRLAGEIQAELNENANQRGDNVKFAMNKRYHVRRGAQVDLRALMRNVPGGATLMNDVEKDVKVVETQDVTRSAYEEQDRLNLDFDDLIGTFSQASVQANRNLNETVGGMEMLTNDSSQMGSYQLRVFAETWCKPVLRQTVKLEQHYETDPKIFTLAGKKAEKMLQGREINEELLMQELGVSVNVGLGATSPNVKLNNLFGVLGGVAKTFENGVLEKLGVDPEAVLDDAFSKAGYDGSSRFFKWGESEDPMVQTLKAQVAELEAELAKREPKELTDAKVRKLDAETANIGVTKAKSGVEAIFGAMQAAEVVATTPAVAPVADQILRAGGWQEPNPAGIDPGFAPGEQMPGQDAMAGVAATAAAVPPGAAGLDRELPAGVDPNSNPGTPSGPAAPASPFTGANGGIETMRSDSEGPDQ
jgi:hypothetical protein